MRRNQAVVSGYGERRMQIMHSAQVSIYWMLTVAIVTSVYWDIRVGVGVRYLGLLQKPPYEVCGVMSSECGPIYRCERGRYGSNCLTSMCTHRYGRAIGPRLAMCLVNGIVITI